VVGVSRISGEVFAFEDFTTTEKVSYFFQLLAGVNLVLFLFNLLPIYPLDGGHIVNSLLEARGASPGVRSLFTRITTAVFAVIVQRAMLGDLRRLLGRPAHGR
jgi:Zn-dependent protease